MNIFVLCEDTPCSEFAYEHGLSLYIQTDRHRILFDLGQSDAFAQNARSLGIDLSTVDIVVLSHGHYDHGGGLAHFLKLNSVAKIYLREQAFGEYYHGDKYIGLDKDLLDFSDRFVYVKDKLTIDKELCLFSIANLSCSQTALAAKIGGDTLPDDFSHEMYLEVSDASRKAVFTGCAHKGIEHIAKTAFDRGATHLVGGFHLRDSIDPDHLVSIASALQQIPLIYYTGHCTSDCAYTQLLSLLGNRIKHLKSGMRFAIGDHSAVARFLFRCGYNCSQSVFGAFADDLGIDMNTAMKISCSFGGGMGRQREVCGAVSGMLLVCGMMDGYATPETGSVKAEHYKMVQELCTLFRNRHGSIICRDLLGGTASDSPIPTERNEAFYRMRPCERLISSAADILEKHFFK